jgi:hypothetical protein
VDSLKRPTRAKTGRVGFSAEREIAIMRVE